jgi:hypothetical protein
MGALAAVEPWFARLARAEQAGAKSQRQAHSEGRVHAVPSTKETVKLGVFDTTLPPILTVDSGDIISYSDTWSHFLNEMQPGVPVDTLAKLCVDNPGRGHRWLTSCAAFMPSSRRRSSRPNSDAR